MIRLTVHRSDKLPESFAYHEAAELTIGRSLNCTHSIDSDPMMSRLHAVILFDPPQVRIKDLNSTNGLTINGERFGAASESSLSPLRDGDEIIIGQTRFVIEIPDGDNAAAVGRPNTHGTTSIHHAGDETDAASATVPSRAALDLPSIQGYRTLRVLSRASTGTVYLAVDETTGDEVAIKILAQEIPFSRKTLDDFRAEIDSAKNGTHPNLIQLLDAGELEHGGIYLAMDYMEGDDLGVLLTLQARHRLPLHVAYEIMLQLSSAICYFHQNGFLHMDIKPSSILVRDDNGRPQPMFTDQGFAHFLDETGILPRGYAGDDVERLAYLPPEELAAVQEPKATADVFSLCALFYRMLAGRAPYAFGEGKDNRALVEKGMITPIDELLPDLPEPLVVIIDRGLALEPEARYQTGCELLDALENIRL